MFISFFGNAIDQNFARLLGLNKARFPSTHPDKKGVEAQRKEKSWGSPKWFQVGTAGLLPKRRKLTAAHYYFRDDFEVRKWTLNEQARCLLSRGERIPSGLSQTTVIFQEISSSSDTCEQKSSKFSHMARHVEHRRPLVQTLV